MLCQRIEEVMKVGERTMMLAPKNLEKSMEREG